MLQITSLMQNSLKTMNSKKSPKQTPINIIQNLAKGPKVLTNEAQMKVWSNFLPSCNNSSDISHPQNCLPIESFRSQWPIVTTAETLGSTMHINNKYHQQQQISMIGNEPSMPIYSFSSRGWPPSRTFPSPPSRRNIILFYFIILHFIIK